MLRFAELCSNHWTRSFYFLLSSSGLVEEEGMDQSVIRIGRGPGGEYRVPLLQVDWEGLFAVKRGEEREKETKSEENVL